MADTVSRSWFAVFPNPEQHGYEGSPEDIIEKLKQEWIGSNPLRKGWWGYCISEKGLPHVHMVLEDTGSCRFTKVKKAYPTAHLEPTKGNKKAGFSVYKEKSLLLMRKANRFLYSLHMEYRGKQEICCIKY